MQWYLGGAVLCVLAARRAKKRIPGQKRLQEAALALAAGFLLAAAVTVSDGGSGESRRVARNEPGKGTLEKEYEVSADGELEEYPIQVQVEERKLDAAERQAYFEKAKEELDAAVLGDNPSLDEVTSPLFLPETLQDGAVEAEYRFSDYDVFEPDGTLKADVEKPILEEVTAELTCQEETCLYTFAVRVVPREKTKRELLLDGIREELDVENGKTGSAYVELPQEMEGTALAWEEKTGNRGILMAFLGAVGAAAILLKEKEEKKKKDTERERQMMEDYPEIVSKLSLLMGAGMNISTAWERIAFAYREKQEQGEVGTRHAYEEMLATVYEKKEGTGELQAFENFGERCHLSAYRRLSSLLAQNIRKGARGMQRLLEEEERDALEEQKARARKAGEEAGTKMLLPMGLMLAIVLVILIVPAGMSLSI